MSYKWPLAAAIAVFLDLVLGGLVVGLNAGFTCPDWPLCNGHILPPMQGYVLVEYFHRLTTSVLSILILVNLFVAWRRRRTVQSWVPTLAVLSFVFLVAQIILGAVIVVFVLPGAFTTIDVAVAMALFSTYVVWTAVCLPNRNHPGADDVVKNTVKMSVPVYVTAAMTYAQVVFGGYFRHSGAGEAIFGQNGYLASHQQTYVPSKVFSQTLLDLHVLLAILVTACALWLLVHAKQKRALVKPALAYLLLVVLQMVLGFASLATKLELFFTTAHWVDASLMLGVSVYMGSKTGLASVAQKQIQNLRHYEGSTA